LLLIAENISVGCQRSWRTEKDLREWLELLRGKGFNLPIIKEGEFINSHHGLRPLLEPASSAAPSQLRGFTVIDRVVGKAETLLIGYFLRKPNPKGGLWL